MGWTNVKSASVCTTGSIGTPPLRVRSIYFVTSTTKGSVSFFDGSTRAISFDTITSSAMIHYMPDSGVRFESTCSITAPAGTVLTVYYD
jgi:hypothetical protein